MSKAGSVVIHGHFYQPPRENPWTGNVEPEPTAAPDHDWNARITRECYAPLARIPLGRGEADPKRINAYAFLSFDIGPTLLEWMDTEAPEAWAAMLAGDRAGRRRTAHGNAIAMPYHHVILPLCSRLDKRSEVRWGIADFRRRFGREPEGMWLPETAVDQETLDVVADEGIAFTVLAPHQVKKPPADGLAGRVKAGRGRGIAVFVYDGPLSHDVAFADLLQDSQKWEQRLAFPPGRRLVSIATDGETYGHHHKFADLALGALLHRLAQRRDVRLENYASVLARHGTTAELELVAPSSWSCLHGVERWRAECGCRTAGGTQQKWRAPLQAAVEWLVGEINNLYVRVIGARGLDPWEVRERAPVWLRTPADDPVLARLIDMDRSALCAMTSCGWFFDDFGALEGRQVLRYAARAITLAGPEAARLEAGFLQRLDGAVSNDPKIGTARAFYLKTIKPEQPA